MSPKSGGFYNLLFTIHHSPFTIFILVDLKHRAQSIKNKVG